MTKISPGATITASMPMTLKMEKWLGAHRRYGFPRSRVSGGGQRGGRRNNWRWKHHESSPLAVEVPESLLVVANISSRAPTMTPGQPRRGRPVSSKIHHLHCPSFKLDVPSHSLCCCDLKWQSPLCHHSQELTSDKSCCAKLAAHVNRMPRYTIPHDAHDTVFILTQQSSLMPPLAGIFARDWRCQARQPRTPPSPSAVLLGSSPTSPKLPIGPPQHPDAHSPVLQLRSSPEFTSAGPSSSQMFSNPVEPLGAECMCGG